MHGYTAAWILPDGFEPTNKNLVIRKPGDHKYAAIHIEHPVLRKTWNEKIRLCNAILPHRLDRMEDGIKNLNKKKLRKKRLKLPRTQNYNATIISKMLCKISITWYNIVHGKN